MKNQVEDQAGRVTVIGSYIVALVMDVDRIPVEGETLAGRNYHATHGGKGSNMAAAVARLGGQATFLGKVGQDAFGEQFLRLLHDEKVDPRGVLFSERYPTAVGFILFSRNGANSIVIDPAACGDFLPDEVDAHRDLVESAEVVLSPLEIPLETALAGARLAKALGKKAILNPAPAVDLRGRDLRCVFALTPNETEARVCLGLPPTDSLSEEQLARRLLELGPENVILTLGERGVLWAPCNDRAVRIPALQVDVVDTVGAGDAFNAGLAVGLSEGKSVPEAIAMGVTAASLSTEKRETIASYPYRREVDRRVGEILEKIGR